MPKPVLSIAPFSGQEMKPSGDLPVTLVPALLSTPWPHGDMPDAGHYRGFWWDYLQTGPCLRVEALMQQSGVPKDTKGLPPLFGALAIRAGKSLMPYVQSGIRSSHVGWSDTGEILAGFDRVAVLLATQAGVSPLTPADGSSDGKGKPVLAVALHAGWDTLALNLVLHPEMPEAALWQGWSSTWGINQGVSGPKLPWLHFLALAGRHEILGALLQRPGVDVNQKDPRGRPPVFYASSVRTLEVLLESNPVLDTVDKDGLTLVPAWSAMGVGLDTVETMQALLPNASANPSFEAGMAGLVRQTLSHVIHCYNGYRRPAVPYTLPALDWATLGGQTTQREVGGRGLVLTAADSYMLGLCGAKTTHELQALERSAEGWRDAVWVMPVDILSRLLGDCVPPAPVRPDGAGFGAWLALRRLIGFGPRTRNVFEGLEGTRMEKLAAWMEKWEEGLGATPVEKLISTMALIRLWHPLLHRTGAVSRRALEEEIEERLKAVTSGSQTAWADLWSNQGGLPEQVHEALWIDLLRLPAVTPFVLGEMLPAMGYKVQNREYTYFPLPHQPLTPGHQAAMYAAMVGLWSDTSHQVRHDSKTQALYRWLSRWLEDGVSWVAPAEDYKWGKPGSRIDSLPLGDKIQAAVSKGRLGRKIKGPHPKDGIEIEPVRKKRL